MDHVYALISGSEWEDIIIFLSKEDAIHASLNYPNARVEIFSKNTKSGYIPSYHHYKKGELILNQETIKGQHILSDETIKDIENVLKISY